MCMINLFSNRIELYQRIKFTISQYRKIIFYILIVNFLVFFLGLLPPVFYKMLIDNVMTLGEVSKLKWILGG